MSGNHVTCPRCGQLADIVDGTFNVSDGAIELVAGPQWSVDVIEAVGLALRKIVDKLPEDPLAEVASASPEVAAQMSAAVDAMQRRSPRTSRRTLAIKLSRWLLVTLASAGVGVVVTEAYDSVSGAPGPASPEQVRQIFREELKRVQMSGSLPRVGGPAPRAGKTPPP